VHESAFEKVRAFRNAYFADRQHERLRVLDVGSGCPKRTLSCRDVFVPPTFEYTGLDLEEGHNVDYVPSDPYRWSELGDESFDVVVSNQVFEHIPYFWITAAEMARVLAPGGLVVVVSPSAGRPHRYPLDCWRFYPDSWAATCAYVGLDLLESYRETVNWRKSIPGVYWRDAMMVARKPELAGEADRKGFYGRIEAIVATRTDGPVAGPTLSQWGEAGRAYERTYTMTLGDSLLRPLRVRDLIAHTFTRKWWSSKGGSLSRRFQARRGRRALEHGAQAQPWP
jgi:SAM-dependent methyltransferase